MIDYNTTQQDLNHYYGVYGLSSKSLLFENGEQFGNIKNILFSNNLHKQYMKIDVSDKSIDSNLILPVDFIKTCCWKDNKVKTNLTKNKIPSSAYNKRNKLSSFKTIEDIGNLKIYNRNSVSLGSKIIDCMIDYKLWIIKYLVLRNINNNLILIHTSSILNIDWDCDYIEFNRFPIDISENYQKNIRNGKPFDYYLIT